MLTGWCRPLPPAPTEQEAYRKFDILTNKHIETLRKYTKQIQDARLIPDNDAIKASLKLYDDALEKYIPVLCAMAKIYWDRNNYAMVEKIFRQSAEFCSEHETWKLNVAHMFFMQEVKYKEAIRCVRCAALFVLVAAQCLLPSPRPRGSPLCVLFVSQVLRADCQEGHGERHFGSDGHCAGQPVRQLHYDEPERGRRGVDARY